MKIPENWTFKSQEVAGAFDNHVREQLPWYDLATGIVVHTARHFIPRNGVVYDMGASTGNIGRALGSILADRNAHLYAVEESAEMCARYAAAGEVIEANALDVRLAPCDLIISFLFLMFIEPCKRQALIEHWIDRLRKGGAIIIFDKAEPKGGYVGTILSRLTLAAKYEAGAKPEEVIAKELSLAGVQRPIKPNELGYGFVKIFQFGDFAGWLFVKDGE